ncbi:MAG: glycosyltransferase family 4 protein [Weeksellaceae bacterium]|nr:glycosyltransferase family 4 protein [Weeksellaceae bacterium]
MSTFHFLSFNDFQKDGGGTIRMYGVLNALAQDAHKVFFYSNAVNKERFHPNIKHIDLGIQITPAEKRKLQFLLAFASLSLVNKQFAKKLERLREVFGDMDSKRLFCFEYLDNSVGYWLKKNEIINSYANDIHGVATLEFNYQKKQSSSTKSKAMFWLKEKAADALDKKVFENAAYSIFVSKAMYDYYADRYNISDQPKVIVPNLLADEACEQELDTNLVKEIRAKFHVLPTDKIVLFAGSFKKTSGVLDLIKAVEMIIPQHPNVRLLLLGDGFYREEWEEYVQKNNLQDKVEFLGRTPYTHLAAYQEIAHILVCPDTQNIFSELIVHFKYLDALLANKIVINGNFASVLEINENEKLSLGFEPSNIADLAKTLNHAIEEYDSLTQKYSNNRQFACENLTYSHIDTLLH